MPTIFLTFLYIYFFKYWHRLNEPFGIYKIFLFMCTYMHNTPINNDLIGRFWNTNLVHDSFMTLRSDIHFDKRRFILGNMLTP